MACKPRAGLTPPRSPRSPRPPVDRAHRLLVDERHQHAAGTDDAAAALCLDTRRLGAVDGQRGTEGNETDAPAVPDALTRLIGDVQRTAQRAASDLEHDLVALVGTHQVGDARFRLGRPRRRVPWLRPLLDDLAFDGTEQAVHVEQPHPHRDALGIAAAPGIEGGAGRDHLAVGRRDERQRQRRRVAVRIAIEPRDAGDHRHADEQRRRTVQADGQRGERERDDEHRAALGRDRRMLRRRNPRHPAPARPQAAPRVRGARPPAAPRTDFPLRGASVRQAMTDIRIRSPGRRSPPGRRPKGRLPISSCSCRPACWRRSTASCRAVVRRLLRSGASARYGAWP